MYSVEKIDLILFTLDTYSLDGQMILLVYYMLMYIFLEKQSKFHKVTSVFSVMGVFVRVCACGSCPKTISIKTLLSTKWSRLRKMSNFVFSNTGWQMFVILLNWCFVRWTFANMANGFFWVYHFSRREPYSGFIFVCLLAVFFSCVIT